MSVPDPRLHFRFADLQSLTDVRAGVTLSGDPGTYTSAGLQFTDETRSVTTAGWFVQATGTFLVRGTMDDVDSKMTFVEAFGSDTHRIVLASTSTPTTAAFAGVSATVQWNITRASSLAADTEFCIVGAYAVNDIEAFIDGESIGTDTSASMPVTTISALNVGWADFDVTPLTGYISEIAYWNTRLASATLDGLSDGTLTVPVISGASGMGFMTTFGYR